MTELLPALPEETFRRVLCVVAHPDDMEYGTSAAVARWISRGIEVGYLLLTRGEAGMPNPPEETARLRLAEQRAACAAVGVEHLTVLEHPDGMLVYGLDLRRDICREIRRFRPDAVVTFGYAVETRMGYDQADHRVAGLVTLDAVRDAGNRWVFAEQVEEGLQPWNGVRQVWAAGSPDSRHAVDVTATFDRGVQSLLAHEAYLGGLDWQFDAAEFLEGVTRPAGSRMGTTYAAPFEVFSLGFGGD
jgi:LmbE family N-acetylglucosaminyl deacetylase